MPWGDFIRFYDIIFFTNTAVSTKVVPQKRYSVRDNAEWSYGYKEFGVD